MEQSEQDIKPEEQISANCEAEKAVAPVTEEPELRLEFPCDFPLKIIGVNTKELEDDVTEILNRHITEFKAEDYHITTSENGNYQSISFHFWATSREEVDNLYIELTKHNLVRWVL